MPARKFISKEYLQESYINQNKSVSTIAMEYGCSEPTVYFYLHFHDLKLNRNLNEDLCGQKFGRLLVIEKITDYGDTRYNCRCDCGNIKLIRLNSLKKGETKSCGCLKLDLLKEKNWDGFGELGKTCLGKISFNALKRNIEFNLTLDYLWNLFLKQNRKCALSGIDLFVCSKNERKRNADAQNASVDRIDSSKGYFEENIQWVHKHINTMKLNCNETTFIKICNDIYDYQNLKNNTITNIINDRPDKILNKQLYQIKYRAKNRNFNCILTIDDLWNLFIEQNGICNISGYTLKFSKEETTASLDRIDSNKDYEIGNIQWVHKNLNVMKMHFNQDYFLDLVYKVALYRGPI